MGGIRLVPQKWKDAETKIHKDCPVEDENYDVFYTNKKFTAETFEFYAKRSETEWFWVIDRDYDFNGKLLYVPAQHERDYIHVPMGFRTQIFARCKRTMGRASCWYISCA